MLPYVVKKKIDSLHVSTSNYNVIKKIYKECITKKGKKQFWNASKDNRKAFYKLIIEQHEANINLYFNVMSGRF